MTGSATIRRDSPEPMVRAGSAGAAEVVRPPGLDPRTKIVFVVLVSTVVMSSGGLRFVPPALLLAVGLAGYERAWGRVVVLPVVVAAMWAIGWLVPLWWTNTFTAILSLACSYLIRFAVTIGVGMHVIATTSPTALSAALRVSRVPRPLAVTMVVMLRAFPVVAAEAGAVQDAMRLRGLAGVGGIVRHPILSIERFVVPMIVASLRASEDLSASALLRGLGSRRSPTAMYPPRLGGPDLLLGLAVVALVAATLLLPAPLA